MGGLGSLFRVLGTLSGVLGIMLGISCAILELSGWLFGQLWAPAGLENERFVQALCYFSDLCDLFNKA